MSHRYAIVESTKHAGAIEPMELEIDSTFYYQILSTFNVELFTNEEAAKKFCLMENYRGVDLENLAQETKPATLPEPSALKGGFFRSWTISGRRIWNRRDKR